MGILGVQTIAHIQVNEFLFLIACGYSVIATQLLTKLATGLLGKSFQVQFSLDHNYREPPSTK